MVFANKYGDITKNEAIASTKKLGKEGRWYWNGRESVSSHRKWGQSS